jgi:hypothetical protein
VDFGFSSEHSVVIDKELHTFTTEFTEGRHKKGEPFNRLAFLFAYFLFRVIGGQKTLTTNYTKQIKQH